MKRFLVWVVAIVSLIAACGACGGAQYTQRTTTSSIERALDSTIVLYDNYRSRLICGGVRISPTHIATAWHCVAAATTPPDEMALLDFIDPEMSILKKREFVGLKVRFSTYGDLLQASNKDDESAPKLTSLIVASDADHDVAILRTSLSSQPFSPLRPTSSPLLVGEEVFEIGHPLGLQFSFTKGSVSNQCRRLPGEEKVCYTQVDITIWPGSSGGGLFDSDGLVVGIASAMARPGIAFYVHPAAIAALMRNLR